MAFLEENIETDQPKIHKPLDLSSPFTASHTSTISTCLNSLQYLNHLNGGAAQSEEEEREGDRDADDGEEEM